MASRGLIEDPADASSLIERGAVLVDGVKATKPSTLVSASAQISLDSAAKSFVSRGGEKLAGALDELGIDPAGLKCLDVGTGSGGFTDCLLERGALSVTAVDVGYGQFDFKLRNDPRVRLIERTNFRLIPLSELDPPFDLIVGDLSFISLTTVMEKLAACASAGGRLLLLVKPQFEAEPARVPAGGVIRDYHVWEEALRKVASSIESQGMRVSDMAASRLRGAKGNVEFFILADRGESVPPSATLIEKALAGVPA